MTRGIKIRIIAFIILSSVGIVYVTAAYLGFVDKVLGRGITVSATLPTSGGLFEGSEVTYRGVKVGKVSAMDTTKDGVRVELALEEGTQIPLDSKIYVHNLSAVGEQYLDFEPKDDSGPYAEEGDNIEGSAESLPVAEEDLLVELDQFVSSVDKANLGVVIGELGELFHDTGHPLQKLIDSGSIFIDEASASQPETVQLLENGLTVLRTQRDQGENIQAFSRSLRLLTGSLAQSDQDLRTVLQGTPGAVREVQALLEDLEPTLPVLLGNLVSFNQVVVTHLDGIEQLLVEFPRAVAAGFTGTPGDGYGHVNIQTTPDPPPCSGEGYKPMSEWRSGHDLTDSAIYPAECKKGVPYVQRGANYSPGAGRSGKLYRGTYDPSTGLSDFAVDEYGNYASIHGPENLSVLGGDSWKWLLAGPVAGQ
jgi:phospholipid/cholesterol/gamma-HCH transport system substrate-binding protein